MRRGRRAGSAGSVLVVSHEASRTGAPRVAVDLLGVLSASHPTLLVQRWGGPLAKELAYAAGSSRSEPLSRTRVLLRRHRRTRPLARGVEQVAALWVLATRRPDLVWLNTVLSASWVGPARRLGIPVVLHVHELEPMLSTVLDRYRLPARLAAPGVRLVACSAAVADRLTEVCRLPPGAVTTIESVPRPDRIARLATARPEEVTAGRTVVSCGTADERKGFDTWLEMASIVLADPGHADVRFVWVGRAPADADAIRTRHGGRVSFTGEMENPYPVLAAATVFTLLSRVDPFPLAVLEAMVLGRPVVVSAAGGMPDQVGDSGVVVPVGDPVPAAAAVSRLLDDDAGRDRLGSAGADRARTAFGFDRFAAAVTATVAAAATVTVRTAPSAGPA